MAKSRRKTTGSRGRTELLLLGGGGHGVVVAEGASLAGLSVRGVLDDRPDCPAAGVVKHLGPLFPGEQMLELLDGSRALDFILCLGDVKLRRRVLDALADRQERARSVVHPAAFVSPSAKLGRGVFVGPGAVVHSRAVIEDHAIINSGAIIEHDCVVGENTHVAPGVVLAGTSRTGRDSLIGVGSRVLPGMRVGERAVVGAGAVVIANVEPGKTVMGVPAR